MKVIQSQVFGDTILLEDEDEEIRKTLKELIDKYPVDTFGFINKNLNSLGYLLTIGLLDKTHHENKGGKR